MQDWIEAWAALIDTNCKLSKTFSLSTAYWQALLMVWPKQAPSNDAAYPNSLQLTTVLRAYVIMPRLVPLSLIAYHFISQVKFFMQKS